MHGETIKKGNYCNRMHGKCKIIRKSTNIIPVLFVMVPAEIGKNQLKILTIMTIKIGVFLDATSCRLVEKCPHFIGF